MLLPIMQSKIADLMLLQNRWSAILNTLLRRPQNSSNILTNVSLVTGSNTINHGLGQNLTGWKIIRQRAAASIYDAQDANQMPSLTLVLVSSAPVSIDLEVF